MTVVTLEKVQEAVTYFDGLMHDNVVPYALTLAEPGTVVGTVPGNLIAQVIVHALNDIAQQAGLTVRVFVNATQPPVLNITPQVAAFGTTLTATITGDVLEGDQFDSGNGGDLVPIVVGTPITFTLPSSGPYTARIVRDGQTVASKALTATTPVVGPTFRGPEKINAPGQYALTHQSVDDPTKAAFEITAPGTYVIDGGEVRSKGIGIKCRVPGVHLTVRNVKGTGLNPNVRGRAQDRFIDVQNAASALIEHNESDGFAGIYFLNYKGNGTTDTFIVRLNRALNINGQFSNGNDGYLTGQEDFYRCQFLQFNNVNGIPGALSEWNYVKGEPRKSHVEDNHSVFNSSGKSNTDRIRIRNSLVDGAFTFNPALNHTGSGIALLDGGGQFAEATDNVILECSNAGIFVSDGNYASILRNIVLGRGVLADGTFLDSQSDAGIYVRDYKPGTPRIASTVLVDANTVGWGVPDVGKPNARNDINIGKDASGNPLGTLGTNTKVRGGVGPITAEDLQAARDAYWQRVADNGLTIGLAI